MAEDITYAEMNLTTGRGQGQSNSVLLQDENLGVTYAAVTKPKKKKPSKQQKVSQIPHNTEDAVAFTAISMKTPPKPPQQKVSAGGGDVSVTMIRESTKKTSRKWKEAEKDQCEIIRGDDKKTEWRQKLNPGRHCSVLLVPSLAALCLVLLITTITGCTSCTGDTTGLGNESGSSSTADSSSPCPDPWILITNKCYYFSETTKTQRDSTKDCESRNSRLATVKEGTILSLVTITEQEFWIGLEGLGTQDSVGIWSGRWLDGSVVNITEGSGTCAKIKRVLSLHNCLHELHWICERDLLDL